MSSSLPSDTTNGDTESAAVPDDDNVPPARTPNGDADLLSSGVADAAAHLQDTPHSEVADFSIEGPEDADDGDDDDADDDVADDDDDSVVDDENAPLEVDYGNDSDDNDEGTEDTTATEGTSDGAEEASFQLAQRTNAIMSSYKDYIAEIQSEPIEGGDAELGEADLEKAEWARGQDSTNGTAVLGGVDKGFATGVAPHRPFTYSSKHDSDSADTLQTSSLSNLRDVALPAVGEGGAGRDDHSYEDFYGELSFHPRRSYRFPILRSNKFQRMVLGVILTIVMLAVIGGVTSRSKNTGSDLKIDEGSDGGDIMIVPTDSSSNNNGYDQNRPFDSLDPHNAPEINNQQITTAYQSVYNKYQPEWFDRTKGWLGQTYVEAILFCATHDDMFVCPYEVVCPLGSHSMPSGGIKLDGVKLDSIKKEQWAPIMDISIEDVPDENKWVSVGSTSCLKYEEEGSDDGPEWGLTGEGNEGITRHIMCCSQQQQPQITEEKDEEDWSMEETASTTGGDTDTTEKEESNTYAIAMAKYQPNEYNRQKGWTGQTYPEAYEFCTNLSLHICPYDAICPLGPKTEPFKMGDIELESGGSAWVPISDRGNDWVQVGTGNACIKYSTGWNGDPTKNPELPDWGLTGVGNEEFTRHVFCCVVGGIEGSDSNSQAAVTVRPNPNPDYETIGLMYKPQWFSRSSGWTGKTYVQALAFCTSAEHNMLLCPYKAICPHGENKRPYGGDRTADDGGLESWAPIMDTMNGWVQIGPEDSCKLHSSMYAEPPQWGLDGNSERDMMPHVICCELNAENEVGSGLQEGSAATIAPPSSAVDVGAAIDNSGPFAYVKEKYKPISFDRSNGWTGQTYDAALGFCASTQRDGSSLMLCPFEAVCPTGPMNKPYEGFVDEMSWVPVSNDHNWWVQTGPTNPCVFYNVLNQEHPYWGLTGRDNEEITRHIWCCVEHEVVSVIGTVTELLETEEWDGGGPPSMAELIARHQPQWFHRPDWEGVSYPESIDFCSQQNMMLCPYEAYCPQGPGDPPFDGAIEEPSGSWAPITDKVDDWVSVSSDNVCVTWSNLHDGDLPDWGMSGQEDITRHIMCCSLTLEEAALLPAVTEAPQVTTKPDGPPSMAEIIAQHKPQWFHRPDWEGTTSPESIDFCAQQSMVLCSYEAYCPQGPNAPPFDGILMDEPSGSWAPITDNVNEWVSVSSTNTCVLLSDIDGVELPEFDTEGEEELTRHIMCCALNADEANLRPSVTGSNADVQDEMKYNPQWFGRESGWTGTTYSDSVDFCTAQRGGMEVCPYRAICPVGDTAPVGGVFDDEGPDGSWAPVSDAFNEWVRVSSEDVCVLYSYMLGEEPEWGLHDGKEDVTRHVMCCNSVAAGGEGGTPVVAGEALPPAAIAESKPDNALSLETIATNKYNPQWYGREDGWLGSTYPEAIEFCSSFIEPMIICPFEAYCPNGVSEPPLGGVWDGEPNGSWAPVSNDDNEWVSVSSEYMCVLYRYVNPTAPSWGITDGEENLTRHTMCCRPPAAEEALDAANDVGVHDEMGPHSKPTTTEATTTTEASKTEATTTTTTTEATTTTTKATVATVATTTKATASVSVLVSHTLQNTEERYNAKWHDRSLWKGQTYTAALQFCAKMGSGIPCPYEAYCPMGTGEHVVGGMRGEQTWAPMMDIPNGWVSVGPDNTCYPYHTLDLPPEWGLTGIANEEVTRHIMCCHEPEDGIGIALEDEPILDPDFDVSVERSDAEQAVMDYFHPVWYGRKHGYKGTSNTAAEQFCKNIGGKRLCRLEAYCPDGVATQVEHTALFLDRPSFEGEQWAPVSNTLSGGGGSLEPDWVMVGTVGGFPTSTCATYESLKDIASWDMSGSPSEHKQHVLCCTDEVEVNQVETLEEVVKSTMKPVWFDAIDGWNGGSWVDATLFCNGHGGRELCHYSTYCPYGSGKSVMGGHRYDFDREGEQWAPLSDKENTWVMIGQKYQNSATTCMLFEWLEGTSPGAWGRVDGMAELKKHIMCCMPPEEG